MIMFTHKDIENKSIFVINGLEHQNLRVKTGFLFLEDTANNKAITKFPFPKILFLIIIGHTNITSALIESCNKHKIPVVVMKPNFRNVLSFGNFADANFLLRKKQHLQPSSRQDIAKAIITNKFQNQLSLLTKTRKKDLKTKIAIRNLTYAILNIDKIEDIKNLMALEGRVAKFFFAAYFQDLNWTSRKPRIKSDQLNSCLDISYTILFNFIENMCRLFGFDLYVGIYHQLWFRRKSLVCDLIEPFRCIVEHQVLKSFNYSTFKNSDFENIRNSYVLKYGEREKYTSAFYKSIIPYKSDIFKYIQNYYRCFMADKLANEYPTFNY